MREIFSSRSTRRIPRIVTSALVAAVFQLAATVAAAATFTVNSPADVPDANPGDGVCETAPGNKVCTLRAAVQESNAFGGDNTIMLQANVTYTLTRAGDDDTALNGDLDITGSVNIVGAGPNSTIIDGNSAVTGDRVFQIFGTATISGVTIQNGKSASGFAAGGGIFNDYDGTLTLSNCTVSSNSSTQGGGGIVNNYGTMTIIDSTISGNSTLGVGGGILNDSYAPTTILNSTINANSASQMGGGIFEYNDSTNAAAELAIINSTISGNFSGFEGGGIYTDARGKTGLYNVTVTQNQANSDDLGNYVGGGVANNSGSTFTFINSIIARNVIVIPMIPFPLVAYDDCAGTISSGGNNIMYVVDTDYCTVNGSVTMANPLLGPLQFNGGVTQTHALLDGSPAIDAGNTGGCTDNLGAPITTDQRGVHRPYGPYCDIGAFEFADIIFQNGFDP